MKESCCEAETCTCAVGEWGNFEDRPRDPDCLTAANGRDLKDMYEHCDACWDAASYVAEVPRQRALSATRIVDLAPARFRLCAYHGDTLLRMDRLATIHEIGIIHGAY